MFLDHIKSWALEVWALAGAFTCTTALITLLASFDGRKIFEWNNITLNTIISTLSVFMKAMLLYAVAECIGQWKWILLHQEQKKSKLLDFERIDQASRGPLGCLELCFRWNTPWLLRLGLVVTMFTIAMDPFSQQLVQLEQGVVFEEYTSGEAWILRTREYTVGELVFENQTASSEMRKRSNDSSWGTGGESGKWRAEPGLLMELAILNGLARPYQLLDQQNDVYCSTGNCTWDKFETLGVCFRCEDLTDKLEIVRGFSDVWDAMKDRQDSEEKLSNANASASAFTLPNGHYMLNIDNCRFTDWPENAVCKVSNDNKTVLEEPVMYMTTYGTSNPNRTNTFKRLDTLIWSMSIISLDDIKQQYEHWDWLAENRETLDPDKNGNISSVSSPFQLWPTSPMKSSECALYYCVKEIESKVEGGVLTEISREAFSYTRTAESFQPVKRADTEAADDSPEDFQSLEFDDEYAPVPRNPLTLENGDGLSYSVSDVSVWGINRFLQKTLRTSWPNSDQVLKVAHERIPYIRELYNGAAYGTRTQPVALSEIIKSLDHCFEMMAQSMTSEMRNRGGRSPSSKRISVDGRVGTLTTTYRIVWYWIFLHGLIILGSVSFCLATARMSRDMPIWKSHSLATMSQGSAMVDFRPGTGSVKELEKRAAVMEVSLVTDENGKLLEGRESDHTSEDEEQTLRTNLLREESITAATQDDHVSTRASSSDRGNVDVDQERSPLAGAGSLTHHRVSEDNAVRD